MLFYLFSEFVSCQWTKKDKEARAPGIMRFITRFNHVTSIISYGVVHGITAEQRSKIIEFWIKTAAHCRDLNNFNACVEIVSALNASAVHRLKKSWELVSKPVSLCPFLSPKVITSRDLSEIHIIHQAGVFWFPWKFSVL